MGGGGVWERGGHTVRQERTMPCVGTEEPVAIESDGYLLDLLALFSYVLHLTGQIMREFSPRPCFVTR